MANAGRQPDLLEAPLPSDPEAESRFVAALLLDPSWFTTLPLPDDAILDIDYRRIYQGAASLVQNGTPLDVGLLPGRMAEMFGETVNYWSGEILATIHKEPNPANAPHYHARVVELHRKRTLHTLGIEIAQNSLNGHGSAELVSGALERLRSIESNGANRFHRLTSAELDSSSDEQRYIVRDIVPERQGGIISGRFKSLKTSIAVDLSFSIATGTPFLGTFEVLLPTRCGIISAESGLPTLREIGRRVAKARGMSLSDADGLFWSAARPNLCDPLAIEQLRRFVFDDGLGVLVLDPSYLMLADVGDSASNVFKMGSALTVLTRFIEETGCTLILCNHNRKNRGPDQKRDDPPELQEISMSGFAEWARWWLLLGPRKPWDEETATHWLWLRSGGSSGHSGIHALTVVEGKRSDRDGRRWEVTVESMADVRQTDESERERRQAADRERIDDEHRRELLAELQKHPQGETKTQLRTVTGLNEQNFAKAIRTLLTEGRAEKCEIVRRNKTYDGYRPKSSTGQTRSKPVNGFTDWDPMSAGQTGPL